ncbi:MAG: PSD1 and planctomycete cytochrome C domain-containing protein [Verrucomicrobiales bacterium]|nr:PSD1 and planctomycete cytochrome C domain-containing protein [Verrucomicrobiales bacterium]
MMSWKILLPGLAFTGLSLLGAETEVNFARDIRPILSDRCFKCHGLDEEARKADLALHNFTDATREGAIVPGDADASLIFERILSPDPDEVMPPPSANKPRLSPEEIKKFKIWIESGAKYEKHWAFIAPQEKEITPPANSPGNAIDGYIETRHREKGLTFSPPADDFTLVRRLYLDLIGIPPSLEETSRFVSASQKNRNLAVEELVDELLAREEYGERWARLWLDLARYADTNGYEKDRPRSIWPYRDWVINALNADMPYDQFSIEQLAGDMLPNPTRQQLIATGFHRNTMMNEEGGIDPLEYRFHAMVDRVATTGTIWLGLTTGCAQCHTHKFDPITHTDYYALFALLNNADEPDLDVPVPAIEKKRRDVENLISEKESELISQIDTAKFKKWLEEQISTSANWSSLRPVAMQSTSPILTIQKDNSVFASGDFTKRDIYDLKFDLSQLPRPVYALRIEALPDERLPAHGPGAAYYEGRKGDFFLSEVNAAIDGKTISFSSANVDYGKIYIGNGESNGSTVFDGNGSSGWSTAKGEGQRHELVIHFSGPVSGKVLDLNLLFERHFVAALGRFRVSVSSDNKEIKARRGEIEDVTKATTEDWQRLYISNDAEMKKLREKIPAYPTTLVMREWTGNTRKTYRHHRGEYLQPKEEVAPAVPAIFNPLPAGQPANRLTLARWLVSEDNPLAARVAVNRAWRAFFGRGIVHTAGDFGYQSELPSHPELIDYLAVRFMREGWAMKKLHKWIATSRTYQQSSRITAEALATDPDNIYLARGPRFRMDGEMIRDAVLKTSGLLTQKTGGPGVFPPQPASVAAAAYGNTKWDVSKGPDRYRRSLYTFMKRTAPFAAYLSFDGPTGENCLARRERSNTPLQALTLLNDEMFIEASVAIAKRISPGEPPQKTADHLFQTILTRPATDRELGRLISFYHSQLKRLQNGDLQAAEILGDKEADPRVAAWAILARAIYNLDEAVTKG